MAGIARELGQQLVKLMAAFPDARRDAKLTMAVYAEALEGIAIGSIEVAVGRAIREVKFFPSAAELREFAAAHALALEVEAKRRDGKDSDQAAMWRVRLASYTRATAAGRKPYWPDTWGPLPTDHECQAPDAILAAFGVRRALAPPRLDDAKLAGITGAARMALAEIPGTPRRPHAGGPETAGERAVRERAAEAGRAWHRERERGGAA